MKTPVLLSIAIAVLALFAAGLGLFWQAGAPHYLGHPRA